MWRAAFGIAMIVAACSSGSSSTPPAPAPSVPAAAALPAPSAAPLDVAPPADRAISIGRGRRHACVVRQSGVVDCWGQHLTCRRCALPPPADPTVRRAAGVRDALAISRDARCVVRRGGGVACLSETQLAFEPLAAVADVRALDPASRCVIVGDGGVECLDAGRHRDVDDALAVASDGARTCVLARSGTVSCDVRAGFAPVPGLTGVRELAVADLLAAGVLVCTARRDGAVGCVVVDETTRVRALPPEVARALVGAVELGLAADHTAGVARLEARVDGAIVQVTLPLDNTTPVQLVRVPDLRDAVAHANGCAIRATGAVACWGANDGGALGQPTTLGRAQLPATIVVGLAEVTHLALEDTVTWARTRAGHVLRWGGEADGVHVTVPTEDVRFRGATAVSSPDPGRACIDVGTTRTCARQTGTGPSDALPPALPEGVVERMTDMVEVVCDRGRDGRVRCGDEAIAGITAATRLVGGDDFACVLQRATVQCWRYTWNGAPARVGGLVAVPGIAGATALAASRTRACAVHGGGRVTCFDPAASTSREDVIAAGAIDVVLGRASDEQLTSRGGPHAPHRAGARGCALMNDRRVQCWGTNLFGELGDGSVVERVAPVGVRL